MIQAPSSYFLIRKKAPIWGFLLCPLFVFSAETTLEIEQSQPDRQKAVQSAIQQLSQDLMERFIEPSKLKAQKKRIQKIISTYSNRYILYTKTESPVKKGPKSFVLPIRIGFSEENLKKILLKEDLFYSGSSHLRILPLILLENKVEKSTYGWWRKKNKSSQSTRSSMSVFYSHIQSALLPYHFFIIHPEQVGNRYFTPPSLLSRRSDQKKMFQLARFFQSHLIMTGTVTIRESEAEGFLNMKVQLSVYNTSSGRLLAEVERFEKVPRESSKPMEAFLKKNTGFAKSLGAQLQLIYEEGQISSHSAQIQVESRLTHQDLERFKKELIQKTPALTHLQEHIISQKSLTYIAQTSAGLKELSQQIKSIVFASFDVRVMSAKKNQLKLKVSLKE